MGAATSMPQPSEIPLVLIPSAPTDWDGARRLQGNADLPLGREGQQALLRQLETLNGQPLAAVLSAPDEASQSTANAVAARTGEKPRVVAGLAEADLGLWQGLREEELTDRFAKSYSQWRQDPGGVTPPGGESIEEATGRILAAFAKCVLKAPKGTLGVVLRPTAMAVVRAWLRQAPIADTWGDEAQPEAPEPARASKDRLKELADALKDTPRAPARRS